jgi:hypothetical protein
MRCDSLILIKPYIGSLLLLSVAANTGRARLWRAGAPSSETAARRKVRMSVRSTITPGIPGADTAGQRASAMTGMRIPEHIA